MADIGNMKIEGVVYKYTSPSGKVYIGQTMDERHRINTWNCVKYRYAGSAINRARAKYGPENFKYEVLYRNTFSSIDEAHDTLDKLEVYYIGLYDSLKNGYNNTVGGLVPEYGIQTQINGELKQRERGKLSKNQLRKFSGKHTKEEINKMRMETNRKNGRWKKVNQFDLSGRLVRTFICAQEAQDCGFGSSCNIRRACKKLGKYYGYYWRYASDGDKLKLKSPRVYTSEQFEHSRRAVTKYTKEGKYVADYNSLKDAANSVGVSYTSGISACISGRLNAAHGYKWEYKKVS